MALFEKPKGAPFNNGPRMPSGQFERYAVLPEAERAKGFIRPVRKKYRHLVCDTVTTMDDALAETWAADPNYYGATYCCSCRDHLPVSDFVWEEAGERTCEVLGS